MEEYEFWLVFVTGDIAENVALGPAKGIKIVTVMLAVLLMRPANRRHLWKEAAMGVFNKKARWWERKAG